MSRRGMPVPDLVASLNAARDTIDALRRERDEALAKYQFMVGRAADEKLDGYRELAARAADAENRRDEARMLQASAEEETRRVRADLTAAIAERDEGEQRGRDAERADVVAWLRSPDNLEELRLLFNHPPSPKTVLDNYAAVIEAGRHVGAAGKEET